jgi:beta-mannanase
MENQENQTLNPLDVRITSVNISNEDWFYCKNQRLQFSNLLRNAISQHRAQTSGAIIENVETERERKEIFQNKLQKVCEFLENRGLTKEAIREGAI